MCLLRKFLGKYSRHFNDVSAYLGEGISYQTTPAVTLAICPVVCSERKPVDPFQVSQTCVTPCYSPEIFDHLIFGDGLLRPSAITLDGCL